MNKYPNSEEEYENPIDFLGIFIKYLSYWKWFIASLVIFLTLGIVYLKFALPSYEITTAVLLKDDQKGGGTAEINAFKEMGLFTQKNNVDNELEVLNKSILVQQVVRELGIYATYTQVETLKFISALGINGRNAKFATYDEKILYGTECPILVSLPDTVLNNMTGAFAFEILIHPYGEYEFSGVYNDQRFLVKASISDHQVMLPFGKINIVRGKYKPTEDMVVGVVLQNPMSEAGQLLSHMKLELTSKTTSVVNISFSSPNVQMGKDFLKKLIEVYNREDLKDQMTMANKTANFIDERLISITKELGTVESQVENYKQDQGITDIKSQTDMFIKQTGDFGQKRMDVETQLAIVSDIDSYIHKKENRYQPLPANTGIRSEGLNELINNYNKLLLQQNRLSRIASSSNQAMIDLTNQLESLFSTVQTSIRNEKNNLLIAQRDLMSKNSENAAHIRAIPRQEREYTEIKRQQSIKEALFLFLLQKKEEKYLNGAVVEPIAKLIDNVGSSGDPISPKKSMILLLSFVIGLIVPIIGIKLRDSLRYQIESKEELEEMSNVPILGEIIKTDQVGNVIIQESNTDSFTELFRLLRTNLLFVMDSSDKKVINMVSSVSGEGKTFVTINLAMSLALLDKKVLVIGLDIRKPKLADYLNLNNDTGITMYLSGHLSKDKLIRPSGIHPNLSVITSGPIPPNPNELLAKPSLDKLIAEYREQFDYLVIDTAPIGVVSDSFLLNRFADMNLYVVRADYTPRKNIADATNLFKNNKLNNLYFVLNGSNLNKKMYRKGYGKKYGYGYGFSKKYGNTYGYGNENEKKGK
ncbi:MAG TPA: polysaccharide biosynthesis tyrosine autokinase [Paludibacter sp.]|nr:polysaccharide biosynthesis tyrosine autokinase [Paludibacter sp.]